MNVLGLHPRTWDADQLRERREELRGRGLEPVTFDKLFKITLPDDASDEELASFREGWTEGDLPKINGYLSGFVLGLVREDGEEVEKPGGCPCCLATLGGFLTGSFEWGLVHGEGSCSACGWPVAAYHRLYLDERGDDRGRLLPEHRDQRGEPNMHFDLLLPAHPDAVRFGGEPVEGS
jgi:hypothetical protein